MVTSTLNEHSIRSLEAAIDELTAYTHKAARKQGLLGQDEDWFSQTAIANYTMRDRGNEGVLEAAALRMAPHTQATTPEAQQSFRNVVNVMGADRIVLNALDNAYRAAVTPSPAERFADFFKEGLSDPDTRGDFIRALQGAKDQMIISIVQTMHPTIYHTKFARAIETELTGVLEAMVAQAGNTGAKKPDTALLEKAKKTIDRLMEGIKEGKPLTPDKRVTVAEENTLDRADHNAMKKSFEAVIDAYNNALKEAARHQPLPAEESEMLAACVIDPQERNPIEYRTWAYAADSDGRDKATSLELYRGIYRQGDKNKNGYRSRKRDPRSNAGDQMDTVSCLIQAAMTPTYDQSKTLETYLSDVGEGQTVLQEMSEEQQVRLLRELAASNNHFSESFYTDINRINAGTLGFNEMFMKVYRKFLKDNDLPDTTELESLRTMYSQNPGDDAEPRNMLLKLANVIAQQPVVVDGKTIDGQWDIDVDNLTYEKKPYARHSKLLADTQISDGSGDLRKLTGSEERKLLDVVKRLQVLNHAIDQYGPAVADRYQIAEFSGAADFYATLLLFKETGIIKVEDGKVVGTPKLSIQPLLETFEDQKNAAETFRKLLEDPLVRSYYKGLGRANIMFGYSDGSKSAGNFASEWSIRENALAVQKVFEEACERYDDLSGVEIQVLHGRGRGDSRGGQFLEGQNQRMMAPELAMSMRNDVTMQSDLPMHMAISSSYGQDTCASILAGTITAKTEAEQEQRRMQDPAYARRMADMDSIIDDISNLSKDKFRELVAYRPETTILLETVHDNPLKSSRAPQRKANTNGTKKTPEQELDEKLKTPPDKAAKKLGDTRAITVEYGFEMADAPLNYIGLKTALQKFIKRDWKVTDAEGREHTGIEGLRVLYEAHPFFRGMMDKTAQGLNNYDPAVFLQYARFAGVEEWAEDCIKELGDPRRKDERGLLGLVEQIRGGGRSNTIEEILKKRDNRPGRTEAEAAELDILRGRTVALDKTAHALALSLTAQNGELRSAVALGRNPFKPNRDHDPVAAQLVDGISFVAQAQHPENLLFPPAGTSMGVWHNGASHQGVGR